MRRRSLDGQSHFSLWLSARGGGDRWSRHLVVGKQTRGNDSPSNVPYSECHFAEAGRFAGLEPCPSPAEVQKVAPPPRIGYTTSINGKADDSTYDKMLAFAQAKRQALIQQAIGDRVGILITYSREARKPGASSP